MAWSDPLIIRIFYINQHRHASEWTFERGSWTDTSGSLAKADHITDGTPVAASRSVNGSGRYLEYFYTEDGNQIKYLAKNSINGEPFQMEFADFKIPVHERLSKEGKAGIAVGILGVVVAIIGIIIGRRRTRKVKSPNVQGDVDASREELLGGSTVTPVRFHAP